LKAATIKSLKDELAHKSTDELKELCLQLARFKVENKELLTYLLFEAHNEEQYIENCKLFIDNLFDEIDTKNVYYVRKKMRKILSSSKKLIRFSKKKETEAEILLHFCKKLKNYTPFFRRSTRLQNIFQTQLKMAKNAILKLHEDLQYDYQLELDNLSDNE
jgi:succinate dehydrogenase/fumarate reductase flavoprotein subunit